jgi:hypothetical protein
MAKSKQNVKITWTGRQLDCEIQTNGDSMTIKVPSGEDSYTVTGTKNADGVYEGTDPNAAVVAHWARLGNQFAGTWTEAGVDWMFAFKLG